MIIGPYGFDGRGGEPGEAEARRLAGENETISHLECDIEGHNMRFAVVEGRPAIMCVRCLKTCGTEDKGTPV